MSQNMSTFYNNYNELFRSKSPIKLSVDVINGIPVIVFAFVSKITTEMDVTMENGLPFVPRRFLLIDDEKVLLEFNLPFYYFDSEEEEKEEKEEDEENEEEYRDGDEIDYIESTDKLWAADKKMREFIIANARIELAKIAIKTPNVYADYHNLDYFQRQDFMNEIQDQRNSELIYLLILDMFLMLSKSKKRKIVRKSPLEQLVIDVI